MSTVTISGAGAHASAATTDRLPASKAGVKGYLALSQVGTLFGLIPSGQTVTTSSPLLDLAQTWNAGGVTFTGLAFNVTDTASASASLLLNLQVGGASRFSVRKDGRIDAAGAAVFTDGVFIRNNTATFQLGASDDVVLARDAANILAQRNAANAQAFRLYNTYTDASNYERLEIAAISNTFLVRNTKAGTGSARNLVIRADATLLLGGGGNDNWGITPSGHFLAQTDNTYDIGAIGATRPRNLYLAGNATFGGSLSTVSGVTCRTATAIPAGGTAGVGYSFSSTANFGVFFGSGTPTLAAAKGSLYLRSDGSGVADRMYVNTDGSTAWTAITTAG